MRLIFLKTKYSTRFISGNYECLLLILGDISQDPPPAQNLIFFSYNMAFPTISLGLRFDRNYNYYYHTELFACRIYFFY